VPRGHHREGYSLGREGYSLGRLPLLNIPIRSETAEAGNPVCDSCLYSFALFHD